MPLDHRGWAVVGYRADDPRRTLPIEESDLALPAFDDGEDACKALLGKPCPTDNSAADIPKDYPATGVPTFRPTEVSAQFQDAYPFTPVHELLANGQIREAWQGPQKTMQVSGDQLLVSRLGRPLPQGTATGTGRIDPPTIRGGSEPTLSLTFGPGPLSTSLGVGWGNGDTEYLDMNGDRFPDVVTDTSIEFTDPRGGRACVTELGPPLTYAACDGTGPGTVAGDFSVSFNAGLSGSPSKPKSNAKGQGNSTTGGQGNRGRSAQTDAFGAKLGAGVALTAAGPPPPRSTRHGTTLMTSPWGATSRDCPAADRRR